MLERNVPALGIPGFGSIPGVPVPLGTPDLPLHIEVTLATARVSANATGVPGDELVPDAGLPPADVSGVSTVADGETLGAGATAVGALTGTPSARPTALVPAASTGERRPFGSPIPVPWVLAGLAASIMLCGPLLGYARWQLLEGRSR
jgi:hypothetical protein